MPESTRDVRRKPVLITLNVSIAEVADEPLTLNTADPGEAGASLRLSADPGNGRRCRRWCGC
jgi:hypothetical protein